MIDRHTIKFGPAVSQKELEKALHEATDLAILKNLQKMKATIQVVADFEDIKAIQGLIEKLSTHQSSGQR
jgi:hypothetical protein